MSDMLSKVDLTRVLQKWGDTFVKVMRQFMTQQKGVDFQPAKPLAPSTLADRKRRGIASTKRLIDTGALYGQGFVVEASRLKLEVGLSDAMHPRGGGSFDQVGAWNQKELTPDKNYTHNWFGVPKAVADQAIKEIGDELDKQLFADKPWGTDVSVRMSL